jgi:acetylornithine deacetylase/succinyl-diaminopimelate desuccinylase-like protein
LLLTIVAAATLSAAPSQHVLRVREWRTAHERQILGELIRLVSLPNIASNQADIARNADLLTAMFDKRGFNVQRITTAGSPLLVARREAPQAMGSLTFYFHYDGQPTDAKDWTMGPPFAPAAYKDQTPVDLAASAGPVDPDVRIYARSVADDKGPIIGLLAAMDGLIGAGVTLPWNLRIVLDGEEEAGSPNFTATMNSHADTVRGDLAIIVDSPRHPSGLPTVFYGSRGVTGATITIYGATGDLHSGNYGNFVPDPAMALARLLASMKDAEGRVAIEDFYEGIVPLTATERRAIDEIPNIDQKLLEQFGLMRQQHPDSRIEIQHNLPTLSVVGPQAGTVGAGARNAISATATARVEMRLVNGLSAERQVERLAAHVRAQGYVLVDGPPDAARRRTHARMATVTRAGSGFPVGKASMDDPRTVMAASAIRSLDQRLVQMPTIGGSLPFSTFSETLAMPTIGLAVVNFDNNQHAANENLRVGHLWEAIDIFAALLTMQK